jgi:hypothetical protein
LGQDIRLEVCHLNAVMSKTIMLDSNIVIIIDAIQTNDGIAPFQKSGGQMISDEACGACDEYFHEG